MTIWIDAQNILHDDDNGKALTLPSWPKGMTIATQSQIDAIQTANNAAQAAAIANAPPDPVTVLQQQVADLQAQLTALAGTSPTLMAAVKSA